MFYTSSIMHGGGGRADMTCVSCNNVGMLVKVCVCCVCGGGCVGKVSVWVWCKSNYDATAFDEFVGQLAWDKWEVLLELLCCDISSVSDLLVNVFIGSYSWGGWLVGHCDLLQWVRMSIVFEWHVCGRASNRLRMVRHSRSSCQASCSSHCRGVGLIAIIKA